MLQLVSCISQCLILAHLRASVKNVSDTHHVCFGREKMKNNCFKQQTCSLDNEQLGERLGLRWGRPRAGHMISGKELPLWASVLPSVEAESWRWLLRDLADGRITSSLMPQNTGLGPLTSLQACQMRPHCLHRMMGDEGHLLPLPPASALLSGFPTLNTTKCSSIKSAFS